MEDKQPSTDKREKVLQFFYDYRAYYNLDDKGDYSKSAKYSTGELLQAIGNGVSIDIGGGLIHGFIDSKAELQEILGDLVKRELLSINSNIQYCTTVDGRIFYKEGGFAKEKRDKKAETENTKLKQELELIKLKREVYFWKDPRIWLGFIAGVIAATATLIGLYFKFVNYDPVGI